MNRLLPLASFGALLLAGSASAQSYAARFYVDDSVAVSGSGTSWGNAYKYLQDGIEAARTHLQQDSGPVEVWVAAGVYHPDEDIGNPTGDGDRTRSFKLYDDVTLFGGFAGTETSLGQRQLFDPAYRSVLSGDLVNNADESYHVVDGSFAGGNAGTGIHLATLNGFTIENGEADSGGDYNLGGGFFQSWGRSVIANCTFDHNRAADKGGAIYVRGAGTIVSVYNCRIQNSSASKGAVSVEANGHVTLSQCLLWQNGVAWNGVSGGAAQAFGGRLHAFHCTFAANYGLLASDLLVEFGGDVLLANSVVYGGSWAIPSLPGRISNNGSLELRDVLIQNGTADIDTTSNGSLHLTTPVLDGDPRFYDMAGGDCRIQLGSACSGPLLNFFPPLAGGDLDQDGVLTGEETLDLALQPRQVGGGSYDIGAYEAQGQVARYCAAGPNSVSASGARIEVTGNSHAAPFHLTFTASPVPNQPGIFFMGTGTTQQPFGDGFRCVNGTTLRFAPTTASGNVLTRTFAGSYPWAPLNPGGTQHFQAWYRDPAAGGSGFNLSDAISVTFSY